MAFRDALPPTPAALNEARLIRQRWEGHYQRPHPLHAVRDFDRHGREIVERMERKRFLWVLEECSGLASGVGFGVYL